MLTAIAVGVPAFVASLATLITSRRNSQKSDTLIKLTNGASEFLRLQIQAKDLEIEGLKNLINALHEAVNRSTESHRASLEAALAGFGASKTVVVLPAQPREERKGA